MSDSECSCPMDGCDYSGAVGSVKNHITAKTDDAHKGKDGGTVLAEAAEKGKGILAEKGKELAERGKEAVADVGADNGDSGPAEQAEEPDEDNTDEAGEDGEASDVSADSGAESGADGAGSGSMVWVIGAGLVGLYLWLTGQREQGPEVV